MAKAQSILEALRYIDQSHFPPCLIETDSLLLKRILDEVWEPPWSLINQVGDMRTLMAKGVFQVVHVMREDNKLADHLANMTLEQHAIVQVNSFADLDTQGRRILNSESYKYPTLG